MARAAGPRQSNTAARVLSLSLVLAGTLIVPLGLRVVNDALPGADIRDSYLPTVEEPRQRERFDQAAADAVREVQPQFAVIGDSMAGIRIDPRHLTRLTQRRVIGLFHPGSPVAYWYLAFKNLVADNGLREIRGAVFFFRDDQLTSQVQVTPGVLDRVAREREPELDRVLAAHRLGAFSDVHRAARGLYQHDRTRLWAEPALTRAPANWVSETPSDLLSTINTQMFALDRLRPFAATDLAQGTGAALDFAANIDRSLLPEILRLAEQSGIKLAFIRAQRRPTEQGPPPQPDALKRYVADLEAYLESRGVYFYDDWGDPDTPLSMYADGDHLNATGKVRYTERFAEKHARFFQ